MLPTMKKILFITAICLCTVGALNAQSNTTFAYSIGFSTGDLNDFIGQASFRGISIDYRKLVQPNIGVGVNFAWNIFYEEVGKATYTVDNSSLTGKQYRYSNHFPMILGATYYLSPGEPMSPFFGLGIGTIYTLRNTDMNLYTYEQEAWNFALQPEVGFMYTIDDASALSVSAKYNYGFQAGNELDGAQSYISLNVGFVFKN